jgi:hypothetical protein
LQPHGPILEQFRKTAGVAWCNPPSHNARDMFNICLTDFGAMDTVTAWWARMVFPLICWHGRFCARLMVEIS